VVTREERERGERERGEREREEDMTGIGGSKREAEWRVRSGENGVETERELRDEQVRKREGAGRGEEEGKRPF